MLDLVVHRMLELTKEISNAAKSLENLLEHIGSIYKFHGMLVKDITEDFVFC